MTTPSVTTRAWALVIWSASAVVLVLLSAPMWIRLPVVGLFTLFAVGCASVLAGRIKQLALALGTVIAIGLASLILASEIVLYAGSWSALRALELQALVVIALSAYVLIREKNAVAP